MTRKDYIAMASALRTAKGTAVTGGGYSQVTTEQCRERSIGVEIAARTVAGVLAADDPCFDSDRFLKNAGIQTP